MSTENSNKKDTSNELYTLLAVGDYALLDGKDRGRLIHVSDINAQIVLDNYDYSDNEAYPYHNVKPTRLTPCI